MGNFPLFHVLSLQELAYAIQEVATRKDRANYVASVDGVHKYTVNDLLRTDADYHNFPAYPKYEHIPGVFAPFYSTPAPESFISHIEQLKNVLGKLSSGSQASQTSDRTSAPTYYANEDLALISSCGDYLNDWTGDAAIAFKEKFIDPFPSISKNQYLLALILDACLEAYVDVWRAAKDDILSIANNALAALDSLYEDGDVNWGVTLTVAACLLGFAAIFPPLLVTAAPGAAAITAAIVGVGSNASWLATAFTSATSYSGSTPEKVVSDMEAAVRGLTDSVVAQERAIASLLKAALDSLDKSQGSFAFPRSALADATTSSEAASSKYVGEAY
jgi:hypothetical protein